MKKIFDISLVDPLSFIGSNDNNIKLLENNFSASIIVRGSEIKLDGKKDEVEILNTILTNMLSTVESKGLVEESDVQDLIDIARTSKDFLLNGLDENRIILHTYKGTVCAKTNGQRKYLDAVNNHDITFAVGPAGTGKTYQAVASAVSALKDKTVNKIVITRPAVEAGESLGFLPGDLKEKIDPYLTPLYDALNDMIEKDKLNTLFEFCNEDQGNTPFIFHMMTSQSRYQKVLINKYPINPSNTTLVKIRSIFGKQNVWLS